MDTLIKFNDFYQKVVRYERTIKKWIQNPSQDIEMEIENLRTELQRDYSKLERKIFYYGEYKPITKRFLSDITNPFIFSFDKVNTSNTRGKLYAINQVKNILNKSIGKLEAEGETWPGFNEKIAQNTKVVKRRSHENQTIWRWIDKHRILSILGAIAALATIIGVIYSIVFS